MNSDRMYHNQPVRSLQTMLRTIALYNDAYERIIPDGIFGPETKSAVGTFQRNRGLPITGVANRQTWEEIVRVYDDALVELSPAQPIAYDRRYEFPFTRGDHSARVLLAQSMLLTIANRYCCICPPELSGSMDDMMVNSVSEFQGLNGLPRSGQLDKRTWKNLALQFAMAEVLSGQRERAAEK